jgi:hypothetical protein
VKGAAYGLLSAICATRDGPGSPNRGDRPARAGIATARAVASARIERGAPGGVPGRNAAATRPLAPALGKPIAIQGTPNAPPRRLGAFPGALIGAAHRPQAFCRTVNAHRQGHLIPMRDGVVRWRLIDLAAWVWDKFGISVSAATLSRELNALGFGKLSARPRHYAQNAEEIAAFKKTSPSGWRKSARRFPRAPQ